MFGETSPEHAALKDELDRLLRQFFLSGGQLLWGRVHVVVWGPAATLARASEDIIRAGRRLELEFITEPTIGSTLFLQTLPLGFDPAWPEERVLRRARRLPGANLAQLLPQAHRHQYAGAGHIPHATHPEEFVSTVLGFVSDPGLGGAS